MRVTIKLPKATVSIHQNSRKKISAKWLKALISKSNKKILFQIFTKTFLWLTLSHKESCICQWAEPPQPWKSKQIKYSKDKI